MATVWKVASRWSHTGTADSSIIRLFREYRILFVGNKENIFRNIQDGDLIAVSDGKRIVAIAQAQDNPRPLGEFSDVIPEDNIGTYGYSVPACRVSFLDLDPEDCFSYGRIGACHRLGKKDADRISDLFSRYHNEEQFAIYASTRTLLGGTALWKDNLRYRIPVYQRPYSWGKQQIHSFVTDILTAFYGRDGKRERGREPMFIGTMQISAPHLIDGKAGISAHNIIDGQQRLTTLTLLVHLIQTCYPLIEASVPHDFISYISTEVNGQLQQELFNKAIASQLDAITKGEQNNPYLRGLHLLHQAMIDFDISEGEWDSTENQPLPPADITDLISYITNCLHFVVIETHAGLSKTIQIFNSINTSGMDLAGSDVFKVRLFEFLEPKQQDEGKLFESIDQLYQKIEKFNSGRECPEYRINDILSVAQHRLIASHEHLNRALHSLAPTTFFDRLFDVALGVNRWDGFNRDIRASSSIRNDLQVSVFEEVIGQCHQWVCTCDAFSPEQSFSFRLLNLTRYSRYWFIPALFHIKFSPDRTTSTKFISQLTRLLATYSIIYGKVVNAAHSFMHQLMEDMFGRHPKSADEIIEATSSKTQGLGNSLRSCLLNDNLAWIPKAKGLVFRIAIAIDAPHGLSNEIVKLAFEEPMDTEHIYAATPNANEVAADTPALWGEELNKLGNLILLESGINRSIKNMSYAEKQLAYKKSKLPAVAELADHYPEWTPADAECRRRHLVW